MRRMLMKTNEVEKVLDVTKDTLRYYEKVGLIEPQRDDNGYRNYCQDDLRVIKNIVMLRSLDVSIEEIKQIFNDELTLTVCLERKEQTLQAEIKQKKKIIEQIQMNLTRKKAYFGYLDKSSQMSCELYVLFKTNEIEMMLSLCNQNKLVRCAYQDIDQIRFSLCARTYQPILITDKGLMMTKGRPAVGLLSHYYIDLDILIKGTRYWFESVSLDHMAEIFALLEENHVLVEDPLGLKEVFTRYHNIYELERYFDNHIRKWQRQYGLDNPRGSEIYEHLNEFHDFIIKDSKKDNHHDKLYYHKSLFKALPRGYVVLVISVMGVALLVMGFNLVMSLF